MNKKRGFGQSGFIPDRQFLTPDTLDVLSLGQTRLKELREANTWWFQAMEVLRPITEQIRPFQKMTSHVINIQIGIETFIRERRKMAGYISTFAMNGWYISNDFAHTIPVAAIESSMQTIPGQWNGAIDLILLHSFLEDLPDMHLRLLEVVPKRAHFLNEIFCLFERKNYASLIVSALAQADGICKDNFVKSRKDGDKPIGFFDAIKTSENKYAQSIAETFVPDDNSIFKFLSNQLAATDKNDHVLLEYKSQRLPDLNRHAIMHGESLNFGSQINAVKAIVLLDFIVELVVVNRYLKSRENQKTDK